MSNRLAVVGSRTADPREVQSWLIHGMSTLRYDTIVSGGAAGADTGGAWFAEGTGKELIIFEAEWDKYGKSAGYKRNQLIADEADACIAFWDGKSKGTRHTINLFLDQGKPLRVIII